MSQKKAKQPHLGQRCCLKKSQRSLMLAEASQVLSLLTPCIPPAVRGPSTFFDFHRLETFGETSEIAIKVLEGKCIEMVGHLQSCYSFGATNSTFFPCPVSIKCRPKHRYSWSRGCMFLVHMWHVAVVADGIFACKDMKLEKYLVVHPRGAVGQVINRPILFSSLNLQVAHLWQNRLGGK